MLLKRVSLHLCLSPDCTCGAGESPAWISPNLDRKVLAGLCGHSYAPLLYGAGHTTKAHHFCPEFGLDAGGIYCFNTEDPDATRLTVLDALAFCWTLEVEGGGKTMEIPMALHKKQYGGFLQAEWVSGLRFLPPLCIGCSEKISQGPLTVCSGKLYPFCAHHKIEIGYAWGEFRYDGTEIHVSPL